MDMIEKILAMKKVQLEGSILLLVSDGFETTVTGLNANGEYSLNTFCITSFTMDITTQLLSVVVSRRFPIIPVQQKGWLCANGCEFEYEQVELTCNYCLIYNHVVSVDVQVDSGKRLKVISLSSPYLELDNNVIF